jgi:hypothetical protein
VQLYRSSRAVEHSRTVRSLGSNGSCRGLSWVVWTKVGCPGGFWVDGLRVVQQYGFWLRGSVCDYGLRYQKSGGGQRLGGEGCSQLQRTEPLPDEQPKQSMTTCGPFQGDLGYNLATIVLAPARLWGDGVTRRLVATVRYSSDWKARGSEG